MEFILEWLSSIIISVIEASSYAGIFVLMALESANIPIPSEIIMPFAGYLVFAGKLDFLWVVFWGALGNLAGSLASYYLGYFGGWRALQKYGKFLFIASRDLDMADTWFAKYGTIIILLSRVLPVVRTFISFPAGVARMNVLKFSLYTFVGSLLWSYLLTYIGVIMGENWKYLEAYFRRFDWVIGVVLILCGGWWVWRHIKNMKHET